MLQKASWSRFENKKYGKSLRLPTQGRWIVTDAYEEMRQCWKPCDATELENRIRLQRSLKLMKVTKLDKPTSSSPQEGQAVLLNSGTKLAAIKILCALVARTHRRTWLRCVRLKLQGLSDKVKSDASQHHARRWTKSAHKLAINWILHPGNRRFPFQLHTNVVASWVFWRRKISAAKDVIAMDRNTPMRSTSSSSTSFVVAVVFDVVSPFKLLPTA